jgi:hypothetical protein
VAKADVNGDGLEDLFIPGAMGYSSTLWIQGEDGEFIASNTVLFEKDKKSADIAGYFYDLNGDSFPDLVVASGSIEFPMNDLAYQDRLYLNDGKGNFSGLPSPFHTSPTAFILGEDLDQDGDLDLVSGVRSIPYAYGVPAGVDFWQNDGQGNFSLFPNQLGENLKSIGMLTAGSFSDLDGDGISELILAGEWTPIMICALENGQFVNRSEDFGIPSAAGLWNTILVEDLNGDGKPDIIAGNRGLNMRLSTSSDAELRMLVNDFDQNGAVEQILVSQQAEGAIPWVMKNTLLKQIPTLRKQLLTYASYQNKTLELLFPESILSKSITLSVQTLATTLWINDGSGKFKEQALPPEIQQAPVYAIEKITSPAGKIQLLLGGNQSRIKPELGSQMGSYGWSLALQTDGSWKALLPEQSGIFIPGEIRDFQQIKIKNKPYLLTIRINENPIAFEIR